MRGGPETWQSPAPGTPVHQGTARLLDAEPAILERHGLPARFLIVVTSAQPRLQRKEYGPIAGLEITLDEPG